jgi:flagellar biosynthesis protein FlhA
MSTLSMSTIRQRLSGFEFSGLGIPFLVLLIMAMLVVPLHPLLLDVFFTFNILNFTFINQITFYHNVLCLT